MTKLFGVGDTRDILPQQLLKVDDKVWLQIKTKF